VADPDLRLVASVSPDGSTLLLVEPTGGGRSPDVTLRRFTLADGAELAPRQVEDWDGCAPSWLGNDPVVPTRTSVAGSVVVTDAGTRSLVAVHHRLQSSCLELAADALEAGPHRALFGTWTYVWTWYWWQLSLVTATVMLLVVIVMRRRQSSS
jgi:hypothetical protein